LQTIKRDIEKCALMFPHVGFVFEKFSEEQESGKSKIRLLTIVKAYNELRRLATKPLMSHSRLQTPSACSGNYSETVSFRQDDPVRRHDLG
jgi:hypothetical protein